MSRDPTCRQCGAPLAMTKTAELRGSYQDVHVTFFDLPHLSCPQGHTNRFAHPDFGSELIDIVFKGIPKDSTAGVLKKVHLCGHCRADMGSRPKVPLTFPVPIHLKNAPEFRMEITAPGFRCMACGRQQISEVDRALDSDIADAMIAAFQKIKLG